MSRRAVKTEPLIDRRQLRFKPVPEGEPPRLRTGKSARPDQFTKCCLYLDRGTKDEAIKRLRDEQSDDDFSDLVSRLLREWLSGDGAIKPDP